MSGPGSLALARSRDAPLLLLTPSWPELLDLRPGWGGGKLNTTTLLLEALPPEAAGRLIDALPGGTVLPAPLRERISAAAEGDPLFLEELLAMLVDDGVLTIRSLELSSGSSVRMSVAGPGALLISGLCRSSGSRYAICPVRGVDT